MANKGLEKVTFSKFSNQSQKTFQEVKSAFPKSWKVTHVGSTAIKLPGKNIVDILIETKNVHSAKHYFINNKWTHIIPRKKRKTILFKKKLANSKIVHVHISKPKSKDARNLIFFINYLKKNKKAREKYILLKKEAIKLGKTNNAEYNQHKHEFIQSILRKQKS